MTEKARRTKTVYDAALALREAGLSSFGPGDVTAQLRATGAPVGAWEVRGELSNLERMGLIVLDEDVAEWRLVNGASFSIDAANAIRGSA